MLTSGSGSVAPSPLQSEGCGENEYQPGETIVLTATPRTGVFFGGWSTTLGPVLDCGSCAAAMLVMPSIAIDVTAGFVAGSTCFPFSFGGGGTGTGSRTVTPAQSEGCATGLYTVGEVLGLVAEPAGGSVFVAWTAAAGQLGCRDCELTTFTMPGSAATVLGDFSQGPCHPLTVQVGGGEGTVTSLPASSLGCPVGEYRAATVVSITGTPAASWIFAVWEATAPEISCPNCNSSSYTMPGSVATVRALFVQEVACRRLNILVDGVGEVVLEPDRSPGCGSGSYEQGAVFVARAVPSGGQVFGGWSGTSSAVGCRLCEATSYTMPDRPASITAAFTLGPVLDVQPLLVDLGAGGVTGTFRIRDVHPEGGP